MLWYLPLERIDKRYTVLMDRQLKEGFVKFGIDFKEISGKQLTKGVIETGAFLDSDGTNYFKFSQLQKICQLFKNNDIKNGDVFFVSDLWFPGLISIPYMAMFHKINVRICGMMHAGSWTDTDFVNKLKDWSHHVEKGWFRLVDKVFLGSLFHKQDILNKKVCDQSEKLFVTGLPFSSEDICTIERKKLMLKKEPIIVLTGRLDDEKQPWFFDAVAKKIIKMGIKVNFIKTMELNLSKNEYFDLLARSTIVFSAALQENFGYGVLEGVSLGCSPVVPDSLSYVEMYPRCFRYNSFSEAVALVVSLLENSQDVSFIANYYNKAVERIMVYVKEIC